MTSVNYNDGKWYGWNGGECPVHPKTMVEFLTVNNGVSHKWFARDVEWVCDGNPVVAFRVIKEHKEPREFWLSGGVVCSSIESAAKHDYAHNIIHVREVTP